MNCWQENSVIEHRWSKGTLHNSCDQLHHRTMISGTEKSMAKRKYFLLRPVLKELQLTAQELVPAHPKLWPQAQMIWPLALNMLAPGHKKSWHLQP